MGLCKCLKAGSGKRESKPASEQSVCLKQPLSIAVGPATG